MKTRFLLIVISLSFSGCSLIYSYSDNLPQRLNQWMSEKKYNTALNTISHIKPTHKDYRVIQQTKKLIIKKMASYENMAIAKSTQLAKKGYWLRALNLLDEVSDNILETQNIELHRKKLLKKRSRVITGFKRDVLNSQANSLARKIELYKRIKNTVTKNENNELDIAEFDDMRQETSLKLLNRSELQFKNRHYGNALSTIEIALKLEPDEELTLRLNKIKKQIKRATKSNKSAYISEAKVLLNKLSQGYSHEVLKETKEKINWLNKIKGKDKNYRLIIKKLKRHLKTGVKQHFEAARKLYSEGKTQEALSIWLDLKELDPEYPKLQSHINRAEKIIIKLKKLSNKPENKK